MKLCIQGGYCQKNRENEKSAKIEVYLSLQDKNKKLFLLPYGEKRPKQKKIYNKGKYKENEEKQDKIGRKEQIIYGQKNFVKHATIIRKNILKINQKQCSPWNIIS